MSSSQSSGVDARRTITRSATADSTRVSIPKTKIGRAATRSRRLKPHTLDSLNLWPLAPPLVVAAAAAAKATGRLPAWTGDSGSFKGSVLEDALPRAPHSYMSSLGETLTRVHLEQEDVRGRSRTLGRLEVRRSLVVSCSGVSHAWEIPLSHEGIPKSVLSAAGCKGCSSLDWVALGLGQWEQSSSRRVGSDVVLDGERLSKALDVGEGDILRCEACGSDKDLWLDLETGAILCGSPANIGSATFAVGAERAVLRAMDADLRVASGASSATELCTNSLEQPIPPSLLHPASVLALTPGCNSQGHIDGASPKLALKLCTLNSQTPEVWNAATKTFLNIPPSHLHRHLHYLRERVVVEGSESGERYRELAMRRLLVRNFVSRPDGATGYGFVSGEDEEEEEEEDEFGMFRAGISSRLGKEQEEKDEEDREEKRMNKEKDSWRVSVPLVCEASVGAVGSVLQGLLYVYPVVTAMYGRYVSDLRRAAEEEVDWCHPTFQMGRMVAMEHDFRSTVGAKIEEQGMLGLDHQDRIPLGALAQGPSVGLNAGPLLASLGLRGLRRTEDAGEAIEQVVQAMDEEEEEEKEEDLVGEVESAEKKKKKKKNILGGLLRVCFQETRSSGQVWQGETCVLSVSLPAHSVLNEVWTREKELEEELAKKQSEERRSGSRSRSRSMRRSGTGRTGSSPVRRSASALRRHSVLRTVSLASAAQKSPLAVKRLRRPITVTVADCLEAWHDPTKQDASSQTQWTPSDTLVSSRGRAESDATASTVHLEEPESKDDSERVLSGEEPPKRRQDGVVLGEKPPKDIRGIVCGEEPPKDIDDAIVSGEVENTVRRRIVGEPPAVVVVRLDMESWEMGDLRPEERVVLSQATARLATEATRELSLHQGKLVGYHVPGAMRYRLVAVIGSSSRPASLEARQTLARAGVILPHSDRRPSTMLRNATLYPWRVIQGDGRVNDQQTPGTDSGAERILFYERIQYSPSTPMPRPIRPSPPPLFPRVDGQLPLLARRALQAFDRHIRSAPSSSSSSPPLLSPWECSTGPQTQLGSFGVFLPLSTPSTPTLDVHRLSVARRTLHPSDPPAAVFVRLVARWVPFEEISRGETDFFAVEAEKVSTKHSVSFGGVTSSSSPPQKVTTADASFHGVSSLSLTKRLVEDSTSSRLTSSRSSAVPRVRLALRSSRGADRLGHFGVENRVGGAVCEPWSWRGGGAWSGGERDEDDQSTTVPWRTLSPSRLGRSGTTGSLAWGGEGDDRIVDPTRSSAADLEVVPEHSTASTLSENEFAGEEGEEEEEEVDVNQAVVRMEAAENAAIGRMLRSWDALVQAGEVMSSSRVAAATRGTYAGSGTVVPPRRFVIRGPLPSDSSTSSISKPSVDTVSLDEHEKETLQILQTAAALGDKLRLEVSEDISSARSATAQMQAENRAVVEARLRRATASAKEAKQRADAARKRAAKIRDAASTIAAAANERPEDKAMRETIAARLTLGTVIGPVDIRPVFARVEEILRQVGGGVAIPSYMHAQERAQATARVFQAIEAKLSVQEEAMAKLALADLIWIMRIPLCPYRPARVEPETIATVTEHGLDPNSAGCELTFRTGLYVSRLASMIPGFWDAFRGRLFARSPMLVPGAWSKADAPTDDKDRMNELAAVAVYAAALHWGDKGGPMAEDGAPRTVDGSLSHLSYIQEAWVWLASLLNRLDTVGAGAIVAVEIIIRFLGHRLSLRFGSQTARLLRALDKGNWGYRKMSQLRKDLTRNKDYITRRHRELVQLLRDNEFLFRKPPAGDLIPSTTQADD